MLAGVLWGCGGPAGSTSGAGGDGLQRFDSASLPAVGEAFGPLDDGRLKVAPPDGWQIAPRSSKYLVRF
jgi:hypothetical protein